MLLVAYAARTLLVLYVRIIEDVSIATSRRGPEDNGRLRWSRPRNWFLARGAERTRVERTERHPCVPSLPPSLVAATSSRPGPNSPSDRQREGRTGGRTDGSGRQASTKLDFSFHVRVPGVASDGRTVLSFLCEWQYCSPWGRLRHKFDRTRLAESPFPGIHR